MIAFASLEIGPFPLPAMRIVFQLVACLVFAAATHVQDAEHDSKLSMEDVAAVLAEARIATERTNAAQESGDWKTARAEAGRAVELLAPLPLGEGQDETAGVLRDAGAAAYDAGNFVAAMELMRRELDHRERTLPADHADLIAAQERLATSTYRVGDLPGARALQEAVLAARERALPLDHPDLLRARTNLVITLINTGEHSAALAMGEALLAARERTLPADHRDLLATRSVLASTLLAMGDLSGGRSGFEALLEAAERTLPDDDPILLNARQNLSALMFNKGDFRGARTQQEAMLEARERTLPADDPALLAVRQLLASTMTAMGDLQGASEHGFAVLEALEETLHEDHPDLLSARQSLAATMTTMGEFSVALELYRAVVETGERTLPADDSRLLDARLKLASTLFSMGDKAGAIALYESVLEAQERTLPPDHPTLLSIRANFAVVIMASGDLSRGRAMLETVLEARERTLPPDHIFLLMGRGNLALAMTEMGDFPGARALQESVLDAYERTLPAEHSGLLTARTNLAVTMFRMGNFSDASALQKSTLQELERTLPADHPDILNARLGVASGMEVMGDLSGARTLTEAVLEVAERTLPEDHKVVLTARGNLAGVMAAMGDFADGRVRALERSVLDVMERKLPADNQDLLGMRQNFANTLYETGDLAGARALGIDIAHDVIHRVEFALALSPREAREIIEGETYRHRQVRFLTASGDSGDPDSIRFDLAETLRAASIVSDRQIEESDPRKGELATLRTRLSDLVNGGPRDGQSSEAFASEVARLTRDRDQLERELRGEQGSNGSSTVIIHAQDVARALPEGAAAVGFLRHEKWTSNAKGRKIGSAGDVLSAHVLHSDGSLVEFELGPAKKLELLASEWRASMGRALVGRGVEFSSTKGLESDEAAVEVGRHLRRHVLDPILSAVGDARTLHICLDDFLHAMPIEALPMEEDELVVRDRYTIVNEVSFARLLADRAERPSGTGLLAVGSVAFDAEPGELVSGVVSAPLGSGGLRGGGTQEFVPLAETRGEIEFAGELFERELEEEAVLQLGGQATKGAFRRIAPGKKFLHIATHGWFAPETVKSTLDDEPGDDARRSRFGANETVTGLAPMTLCGLAFAGANQGRDSLGRVPGIMTAEELSSIDLSACELAVLSACETNVGIRRAGQGVQSLQAALHAAGVRTAITSLWKVDDAETRRLMELFYTYLWAEKLPKAEALWKAKCDMRQSGAAVRDWAGWALSGDPR